MLFYIVYVGANLRKIIGEAQKTEKNLEMSAYFFIFALKCARFNC